MSYSTNFRDPIFLSPPGGKIITRSRKPRTNHHNKQAIKQTNQAPSFKLKLEDINQFSTHMKGDNNKNIDIKISAQFGPAADKTTSTK